MKALAPVVLSAAVLGATALGCGGVRAPARDATWGVLDAFQNPPASDRLALDVKKLIERYVEQALAAGPPPDFGELAARITRRVLEEAGTFAPEAREAIHAAVEEALSTAIAVGAREGPAASRELAAAARRTAGAAVDEALRTGIAVISQEGPVLSQELARTAQRTAGAAVRGAAGELGSALHQELGPERFDPIALALAQAAEAIAAGIVRGAAEGARAELARCAEDEGGVCRMDVARTAGKAVTGGALDEAAHRLGPWILGAAGAIGVAFVACTVAIARALGKRAGPPSA